MAAAADTHAHVLMPVAVGMFGMRRNATTRNTGSSTAARKTHTAPRNPTFWTAYLNTKLYSHLSKLRLLVAKI